MTVPEGPNQGRGNVDACRSRRARVDRSLHEESWALDPTTERRFRVVFVLAAIYDITAGIVFTFSTPAFELLGMEDEAPEGGYVPLLGSFTLVLGIAYALIARGDLYRNRDLIVVGTLYKLAYSAIAVFFLAIDQVPHGVRRARRDRSSSRADDEVLGSAATENVTARGAWDERSVRRPGRRGSGPSHRRRARRAPR